MSRDDEHDAFGRPIDRREEEPAAPAPPPPELRGFRPPTDAPPDESAWWAGAQAGTVEGRAHGVDVPGGQPAEWAQRAGAAALDFLIRLALIVGGSLAGALAYLGGDTAGEVGTIAGFAIGVLASWAYAPWMLATRGGQTVGHRVGNTRVVKTNGAPIEGGGAVVREVLVKGILFDTVLVWLSLGIGPLLNYLWPLWDARNEALHDKMCNTRVVTS